MWAAQTTRHCGHTVKCEPAPSSARAGPRGAGPGGHVRHAHSRTSLSTGRGPGPPWPGSSQGQPLPRPSLSVPGLLSCRQREGSPPSPGGGGCSRTPCAHLAEGPLRSPEPTAASPRALRRPLPRSHKHKLCAGAEGPSSSPRETSRDPAQPLHSPRGGDENREDLSSPASLGHGALGPPGWFCTFLPQAFPGKRWPGKASATPLWLEGVPRPLNSGKGSSAPTLLPKLFSHRTLPSKGPLSHTLTCSMGAGGAAPGGSRCGAELPPLLAARAPAPPGLGPPRTQPSAPGPGRAVPPLPPRPPPCVQRASQLRAERLGGEPRQGLPSGPRTPNQDMPALSASVPSGAASTWGSCANHPSPSPSQHPGPQPQSRKAAGAPGFPPAGSAEKEPREGRAGALSSPGGAGAE